MSDNDNVIEGLQDDDSIDNSKQLIIFGTNVAKIPCFKDSFLTGIYAGIGCGIATFLSTSKIIKSTNVSIISFLLVTYGYWFNCRIKWAKNDFICRQNESNFPEEIEQLKLRKQKHQQILDDD